jgi:hypothetical protein
MTPAQLSMLATCVLVGVAPAAAAPDAQPQRIRIEYEKPLNPAHASLYEHVREQRVLERLQELFSPFRLPIDLTIKTAGCDGRSNAWYHRPAITLCYEYLDEIRQSVPRETTPAGVTPADALVGQFFYVVAHEFGHAAFDLLAVPSFGRAEDTADQFSTFMMLQFGKGQARRLIAGAAYSYKSIVQSSTAFVPLKAFSDVHGLPAQRFFNLLCLAYGADPDGFADIVEERYLPKERAADCRREYHQVGFAFQKLIGPHIDRGLAEKVLEKTWLPDPENTRLPTK